jgi:hypothetical protein
MPVRRQRAQIRCICLADGTARMCCDPGVEAVAAAKRELIVQSGLSNSLAVGETSPAARRLADQLLRIHTATI